MTIKRKDQPVTPPSQSVDAPEDLRPGGADDPREAVDPGYLNDAGAEAQDFEEGGQDHDDDSPKGEVNLFDLVQALVFHPFITPNEKVLVLQLLWVHEKLTADDLSRGSTLTPLSVQWALKRLIKAGVVTTRKVPNDELEAYVRVYELPEETEFSEKLAGVKSLPESKSTQTDASEG